MSQFSAIIIGNESLAIQCAEMLLEAGHQVPAVVTRNTDISAWAKGADIQAISADANLAEEMNGMSFDWLLSIANLDMIPDDVLAIPARGAVNFHDGPLPRYAGLNAPAWALINGETEYGISWHMIASGVDEGDLLTQQFFDIAPNETTLTLNTKCYGAAIEGFSTVIDKLATEQPLLTKQDLSKRSYFAKNDRPPAAGRLDFSRSARSITTLVRALDHGGYWNPLTCPKIEVNSQVFLVSRATAGKAASDSPVGTVLDVSDDSITVATGTAPVTLHGLRRCDGETVDPSQIAKPGDMLPSPDAVLSKTQSEALKQTLKSEAKWRARLEGATLATLPLIDASASQGEIKSRTLDLPEGVTRTQSLSAMAALALQLGDNEDITIAAELTADHTGYLNPWVPVQASNIEDDLAAAQAMGPFASDLIARIPSLARPATPALGLSKQSHLEGTALTLTSDGTLFADIGKIGPEAVDLMGDRLSHMIHQIAAGKAPTILPEAERQQVLYNWNATATEFPEDLCIHQAFEAQVAKTPNAEALSFEGETLTYSELNTRANKMAQVLTDMGVAPEVVVGLHLPRSADLVIAALAILKAGGAYLPMDPSYPTDRTAHYIEDSGTNVIITDTNLAELLPKHAARVLCVDNAPSLDSAPSENPESGVIGEGLAYLIYTSGSTGKPKGVMVEHRNVANFFTGMDGRIAHEDGSVWMAVTSLSFDISVLELFWTLSRGFKVVISSDDNRTLGATDSPSGRAVGGMEFSLFYWGNDDGVGRDKYRTLLEGAKFADQNGFCAVWTPERHFHAFGGPYPNPSVTGAAVAAVTQNIGVRAGSCVAPLHHTARIAEEWAVVDNLTNGKAGLAIASGWQPDDFVLRPENTPPKNKPAMFEAIADLRKLWSGEEISFPRENGEMHNVLTQPRPVSKKLDVWVTTAGNPETWKEAGVHGCNVLTHLLGQSVDEVGEKIILYHQALRDAGHNPDDFTVTLMLHSFLAETREQAREIAREPMKDYLRAAAGLIKQYAWAFPAFKKPKGVENPMQLDLGSLTEDELEGILDFAFERYFNDSGLFGTIEEAMERVEEVKAIGVTEIACLIDYGINVEQVLEGLRPLAEVVKLSNADVATTAQDYSIAAQILHHKVTHLQCTPSMAQMLVMTDEAREALPQLDVMMVGGEALPGALATELKTLTGGHVENMYGPTETTIWSTTQTATGGEGVVSIGTPIANTQVYVLDDNMEPRPIGVPGELYIAGAGVTRGYFKRPDLTSERFVRDPFVNDADPDRAGAGLMYRTGDIARWQPDGTLDFLGRADFQVKLRGYRVELGEIETAIDQFEGIKHSVVVTREDSPGQLVAYMLSNDDVDQDALRTHLRDTLPDYMVPHHFVTMNAFPLSPNKKVDRNALPAPSEVQAQSSSTLNAAAKAEEASTTPINISSDEEVTQAIAAIWSHTLNIPNIAPKDNFFDLGGHSLLAVQVHREIRQRLNVQKLSITDIFRAPTLSALSAIVAKKAGVTAMPKAPAAAPPQPEAASETPARPEPDNARNAAMAKRREMRARRQNRT
ncbi:natural product biosynthesis luciferase-like monooxygenase domain-containing protein [Litoreibacter ascidiaceicola]|uniref:Natural product biosynthesis luciferase-like monooxygenase domain-containing protein n=1 Tax=Litoreibacter ascidiaceicola TaxID=1486859 RepID=A0A1M5DUX8_9RHOB|nr:MupA/Atu3671 family FMN-dependent luciferase-like monooxygenase [Litoreibacter ascidiaceicola]SHF70730.1 natural product biosynthesis luciferase-like monooxygenase domain-containing protein [Litoreibacter ascidiaceicola]